MKIKLFAAFGLAVMTIFLLCACKGGGNHTIPENTETEKPESDTKSNGPSSEVPTEESTGPAEVNHLYPIVSNGQSKFKIVHSLTDLYDKDALNEFVSGVEEKTGVKLSVGMQNAEETTYEILIGYVSTRAQSRKDYESLPYSAFSVKSDGNKILVSAYRTADLESALKELLSAITGDGNGNYGIPEGYSYYKDALDIQTAIPRFTLPDTVINKVYYCGDDQFEISVTAENDNILNAYRDVLEGDGFTLHAESAIANNVFATYYKGDAMVHLTYYPNADTLKCVFGKLGYLPSTEPVTDYAQSVTPTLTQLARNGASQSAAGMSFVVQLADGSYIIMDGGPSDEGDEADLLNFLKENNPNEGKPQITWMFTHADPDHMNLAIKFIARYHSEVTVNMVCCNFPDFSTLRITKNLTGGAGCYTRITDFQSYMKRYYPKAETFIFHAGQKLFLPGCEIEILCTHEDQYPLAMPYVNHTCSSWRMTIGGKTVLFLGDCETDINNHMANVYGAELKSDVLQVSHHGLNGGVLALYQLIDPDICLWPVDEDRFNDTCLKYDFNKYLRNEPRRVHYNASHTVTLTFPDLQEKE